MLKRLSRRSRSLLSLGLTALALTLSILAFCTSYWCEGTHKVVKPLCLSPVKMKNCGQNDSRPFFTGLNNALDCSQPCFFASCQAITATSCNFAWSGKSLAPDLKKSSVTISPKQKDEQAQMEVKKLANAVHYIWETGEDKYMLRYFHTGFWHSCEKLHNGDGEKCRSFIELTPGEAQGVLWLSLFSEFMYITLLAMGFLMMWLELLLLCLKKEMHALKVNAFAAICTVFSGMMGMVAHMMYTTVFQLTVSIGPKDWRPQTWDYGWSFALAWISFSCCMAAAVFTLNSYTKRLIEMKRRARIRLEDTASHAPPYEDIIMAGANGSIYSINLPLQGKVIDTAWPSRKEEGLVLLGRCGAQGCEDCEREIKDVLGKESDEEDDEIC